MDEKHEQTEHARPGGGKGFEIPSRGARKTAFTAHARVVAISLIALALTANPAAADEVAFADGFDDLGMTAWTNTGAAGSSQDFVKKQGGVASLRLEPSGPAYAKREHAQVIPLATQTRAISYFAPSGAADRPGADAYMALAFDNGDRLTISFNENENNGIAAWTGSGVDKQAIGAWTQSGMWHTATIIVNEPTHTARVVVDGPSGSIGSSTDFYLQNDATALTSIVFSAVSWGSSSAINFDTVSVTRTDPSTPPRTLTAQPGSASGEIDLQWTTPADDGGHAITGYHVYRSTAGTSKTLIGSTSSSTLAYTDPDLAYETYAYSVTATNAIGESEPSNEASASPVVLSAPQNPSATAGAGDITLQWTPPASDGGSAITHYNIYRSNSTAGPFAWITDSTSTSYVDSGLGARVTRHYEIAAVTSVEESPRSETVSATTVDVPGAPTALSSTPGASVGTIALTWTAPIDDGGASITSYTLYRGTASDTYTTVIPDAASPYTDAYLASDGTPYYYAVSAHNLAGESAISTESTSAAKPDEVSFTSAITVTPSKFWTGDPTTVTFTYSAAVSACAPGSSCPVNTEWRVYLDGTPGNEDGILLNTGLRAHTGHAATESFAVNAAVNPTGTDGAHTMKVFVRPRAESDVRDDASKAVTIDAPLPGSLTNLAIPTVDPTTVWPGENVRAISSYKVFQKQCKSSLSCPVTNEWRLLIDGTPGAADGTLFASGTNAHPAHGQNTSYFIDRTQALGSLDPGAHTMKMAARASTSDPWIVTTARPFTVRESVIEASAPRNFTAMPRYMFSGTSNVSFDYSFTAHQCTGTLDCAITSDWRIYLANDSYSGPFDEAAIPGDQLTSGAFTHPAHGETQTYAVERDVTLNAAPGEYWVEAAINSSAHWNVANTPVTLLSPNDGDGDGVPDDFEVAICGSQLERDVIDTLNGAAGTCQSFEYVPVDHAVQLRIPSNVTPGPDADNDGVAEYVDILWTNITIKRTNPLPDIGYGGKTRIDDLDPDDDDDTRPLIQEICLPFPIATGIGQSPDRDADGIPASVNLTRGLVCIDRRDPGNYSINPATSTYVGPVDPDDNDANNPMPLETTASNIPVWVSWSEDDDADGIPGYRTVTYMNVTWNRTTPAEPPMLSYWTQSSPLDPDDGDPDDPVPYSAIDADDDLIPDVAEPYLCFIELQFTEIDGYCEGSANYVPPLDFQRMLHPLRESGPEPPVFPQSTYPTSSGWSTPRIRDSVRHAVQDVTNATNLLTADGHLSSTMNVTDYARNRLDTAQGRLASQETLAGLLRTAYAVARDDDTEWSGTRNNLSFARSGALADAAIALHKRFGDTFTAQEELAIRQQASTISLPVAQAGALAAYAAIDARDYLDKAFANVSPADWEIVDNASEGLTMIHRRVITNEDGEYAFGANETILLQAAANVTRSIDTLALAQAGDVLAQAIDEIRELALLPENLPGSQQSPCADELVIFATTDCRIVLGDTGDTHFKPMAAYQPDVEQNIILIDFGGNDTYDHAAGGGKGSVRPLCGESVCLSGIQLNLDLGVGRDAYKKTSVIDGNVVHGGGKLGVGILFDEGGDDTYDASARPGGFTGQGAGFSGVGILRDVAGNDTYRLMQVQGGAVNGQGAALNAAFGMLVDDDGDDSYLFSLSPLMSRPYAHGGVQAYATASSQAFLLDFGEGDDVYSAGQDEVQGAASLGAAAFLIDDGGTNAFHVVSARGCARLPDLYVNPCDQSMFSEYRPMAGWSQGYADTLGFAALISGGGNDVFGVIEMANEDDRSFEGYARLASTNLSGLALFYDQAGDDLYDANARSYGFSSVSIAAIFVDAAGNDQYTCASESCYGYASNGISTFYDGLSDGDTFGHDLDAASTSMWRGGLLGLGAHVARERGDETTHETTVTPKRTTFTEELKND